MEEREGGEFPPKKAQTQSDTVSVSSSSTTTEFPAAAKKLARQLDFTGGGTSGGVVLPEHPQSQTVATVAAVAATLQPPQTQPPQVLTPVVASSQASPHNSSVRVV